MTRLLVERGLPEQIGGAHEAGRPTPAFPLAPTATARLVGMQTARAAYGALGAASP
jgi:hypothetical protein